MSVRGLPIKLLIVSFGALTLVTQSPITDDARKLLLIGWVLAFYWALSMWDSDNRARMFREELRQGQQTQALPLPVDEFYDTDRIELQREAENNIAVDNHREIV